MNRNLQNFNHLTKKYRSKIEFCYHSKIEKYSCLLISSSLWLTLHDILYFKGKFRNWHTNNKNYNVPDWIDLCTLRPIDIACKQKISASDYFALLLNPPRIMVIHGMLVGYSKLEKGDFRLSTHFAPLGKCRRQIWTTKMVTKKNCLKVQ